MNFLFLLYQLGLAIGVIVEIDKDASYKLIETVLKTFKIETHSIDRILKFLEDPINCRYIYFFERTKETEERAEAFKVFFKQNPSYRDTLLTIEKVYTNYWALELFPALTHKGEMGFFQHLFSEKVLKTDEFLNLNIDFSPFTTNEFKLLIDFMAKTPLVNLLNQVILNCQTNDFDSLMEHFMKSELYDQSIRDIYGELIAFWGEMNDLPIKNGNQETGVINNGDQEVDPVNDDQNSKEINDQQLFDDAIRPKGHEVPIDSSSESKEDNLQLLPHAPIYGIDFDRISEKRPFSAKRLNFYKEKVTGLRKQVRAALFRYIKDPKYTGTAPYKKIFKIILKSVKEKDLAFWTFLCAFHGLVIAQAKDGGDLVKQMYWLTENIPREMILIQTTDNLARYASIDILKAKFQEFNWPYELQSLPRRLKIVAEAYYHRYIHVHSDDKENDDEVYIVEVDDKAPPYLENYLLFIAGELESLEPTKIWISLVKSKYLSMSMETFQLIVFNQFLPGYLKDDNESKHMVLLQFPLVFASLMATGKKIALGSFFAKLPSFENEKFQDYWERFRKLHFDFYKSLPFDPQNYISRSNLDIFTVDEIRSLIDTEGHLYVLKAAPL